MEHEFTMDGAATTTSPAIRMLFMNPRIYFRRCLSALLRRTRSIREIYTGQPSGDARA